MQGVESEQVSLLRQDGQAAGAEQHDDLPHLSE
jgi:hypothetical protein